MKERDKRTSETAGLEGKGEQRCGKWGGNSTEGKGRKGSINCIYKHVSIVTGW